MEIETDKSIFQEEFKTKMKIGLLTFHAAMNVGAQLQAFCCIFFATHILGLRPNGIMGIFRKDSIPSHGKFIRIRTN